MRLVTKMLAGKTDEHILPELERLHAAAHEATKLLRGGHGPGVSNAANLVLDRLRRIDQSLGAKRMYGLLRQKMPENTPAIANRLSVIPDEISWRLRNLARDVYLQAAQGGGPQDLAMFADLIALLDPVNPGPAAAN